MSAFAIQEWSVVRMVSKGMDDIQHWKKRKVSEVLF
jgi:hypothetical protein